MAADGIFPDSMKADANSKRRLGVMKSILISLISAKSPSIAPSKSSASLIRSLAIPADASEAMLFEYFEVYRS